MEDTGPEVAAQCADDVGQGGVGQQRGGLKHRVQGLPSAVGRESLPSNGRVCFLTEEQIQVNEQSLLPLVSL